MTTLRSRWTRTDGALSLPSSAACGGRNSGAERRGGASPGLWLELAVPRPAGPGTAAGLSSESAARLRFRVCPVSACTSWTLPRCGVWVINVPSNTHVFSTESLTRVDVGSLQKQRNHYGIYRRVSSPNHLFGIYRSASSWLSGRSCRQLFDGRCSSCLVYVCLSVVYQHVAQCSLYRSQHNFLPTITESISTDTCAIRNTVTVVVIVLLHSIQNFCNWHIYLWAAFQK